MDRDNTHFWEKDYDTRKDRDYINYCNNMIDCSKYEDKRKVESFTFNKKENNFVNNEIYSKVMLKNNDIMRLLGYIQRQIIELDDFDDIRTLIHIYDALNEG